MVSCAYIKVARLDTEQTSGIHFGRGFQVPWSFVGNASRKWKIVLISFRQSQRDV
jgi:hypothetical protein